MYRMPRRRWIMRYLVLLVTLSPCHLVTLSSSAFAQIVVIDDVILMTNRQKKQEEARSHQHLEAPGGENLLPPSPGADEPRLGEERVSPFLLPRVLSRRGKRRGQRRTDVRLRGGGAPLNPRGEESALSATLDLPAEEEGPANALALDAAVTRLLAVNADLAAKFQDIPKARADILTAGLRSNPFLFVSISNIPYGHFSEQRPASTSYDLTVIQPIDVNGKRGCRLRAAREAKDVLEAQFQDAVRQEVDKLDSAFIDVLEARQAVAALRAGLTRLNALAETTRNRADKAPRPPEEITALAVERTNAEVAVQRAEATLLQARRELALLLGIPAERAELLDVRGSLHDRAPLPPCVEELIRLALQSRPDLTAYRLGVSRARADLRRERAEAVDNVFLFYTPFTANDYSPLGKQSASGWGLGVLFSVPFFDRNQGDIVRARANVAQTQLEGESLERRIVNEVCYAATEYAVSREVVRQFERDILAGARALRDEQDRLFINGQARFDSRLEAQNEYDEVIHDYLEALVYHRRTMRRLNIAVGQRILP